MSCSTFTALKLQELTGVTTSVLSARLRVRSTSLLTSQKNIIKETRGREERLRLDIKAILLMPIQIQGKVYQGITRIHKYFVLLFF